MRVIDAHAHYAPRIMFETLAAGRDWYGARFETGADGRERLLVRGRQGVNDPRFRWTPEERVRDMDRIGTDLQLISTAPVFYNYDLGPDEGLAASRDLNDDIMSTVNEFPDRFRGLGSVPMQDVGLAVRELHRCMEIGLAGLSLATNVNGRHWDEPEFEPLFEAAEQLGALLFYHANRGVVGPYLPRFHLENTIGHPVEDSIAAASLILGGVTERHPQLKVLIAHGGGNLCYGIARIDRGWEVQEKARVNIPRPPSSYLRSLYYDCITWGEPQLRFLVDQVGADRVVIGSDWPANMGPDSPRQWVEEMASLTAEEKALIFHGNVERLLSLTLVTS